MGNSIKINKVNFEDIQYFITVNNNAKKNTEQLIYLINTLPENDQKCVIPYTVLANEEERLIESLTGNRKIKIIIYGKNANDNKLEEKYKKLYNLGFLANQLYIYMGGLFEWGLLQDIYGQEEFQTTTYEIDILKNKPSKGLF